MTTVIMARGLIAADMVYGGPDVLTGSTKARIGESDVATIARVSLLDLRSKTLVRTGLSDADGTFVFSGIDTSRRRFVVLAEYPGNVDELAGENYMRPVAGVSKKRGES